MSPGVLAIERLINMRKLSFALILISISGIPYQVGHAGDLSPFGLFPPELMPKKWPRDLRASDVVDGAQFGRVSVQDDHIYESLHVIQFSRQDVFEKVWPSVLSINSQGVQLILRKGPSSYRAGNPIASGIQILYPKRDLTGKSSPGIDPNLLSAVLHTSETVPEYIKIVDGQFNPYRSVLPSIEETMGQPDGVYRVRTDIILVVDGDVVDLNRIRLPTNMPIIDQRFIEQRTNTDPRFDTQMLLPGSWDLSDLLPIKGDSSEWKRRENVMYTLEKSFEAGVDVDGVCNCDLAVSKTGLIALSVVYHSRSVSIYSPKGILLNRILLPINPSGVAFCPTVGILVSSHFGRLRLITPIRGDSGPYYKSFAEDVSTGLDGLVYAIRSRSDIIKLNQRSEPNLIVQHNNQSNGGRKLFVDSEGRTFLADMINKTVNVYSPNGKTILQFKTKEGPWGVVASGCLLCYSTSNELVFVDYETGREVHRIQTKHHNSVLALGPSGELFTVDTGRNRVYIYKAK